VAQPLRDASQEEPDEPCELAVLPKPPRELVDWADELPPVVDDVEVVELELLLREPEPLLPLLLLAWFGWQAGEPGTAGPQFCATGPR
jgi:hypothetical protein